jgi:hypothetical protein
MIKRLTFSKWGLCLIALTLGLMSQNVRADQVVSFKGLPDSIPDYMEIQQSANTPEGAAGLFILGMLKQEVSPTMARAFMSLSLSSEQLVPGPNGYKGKQPDTTMNDHLKRLANDPDIARSYVTGSTPQNKYTPPPGDLTFYLTRNRLSVVSPTEVRVYVATSGAGTARPIYMKQESDGIWRVAECSSLFVGIYLPAP